MTMHVFAARFDFQACTESYFPTHSICDQTCSNSPFHDFAPLLAELSFHFTFRPSHFFLFSCGPAALAPSLQLLQPTQDRLCRDVISMAISILTTTSSSHSDAILSCSTTFTSNAATFPTASHTTTAEMATYHPTFQLATCTFPSYLSCCPHSTPTGAYDHGNFFSTSCRTTATCSSTFHSAT